jgi:thiamine-phosphate pyrophosphorylase
MKLLNPGDLLLYLCTDRVLNLGRPIAQSVEEAIAGGVSMVQLREKDISSREFYEIAVELRAVTRRHHVPLVINDRLDIALALGAEGLHLGQTDLPLKEARRLAGKNLFIGASAHTVEEALEAEREGADYLGVGPVYPTGSKADAGEVLGIAGLEAICARVKIPVIGIGGINAENAAPVISAGATGVAVISAILSQPDIRKTAETLRLKLQDSVGHSL